MKTNLELTKHKALVLLIYFDLVRPKAAKMLTKEELANLDIRIWNHDSDKYDSIVSGDDILYARHDANTNHHYPFWLIHGINEVDFIEHVCDHIAVNFARNYGLVCDVSWFEKFGVVESSDYQKHQEKYDKLKDAYSSIVQQPRYKKMLCELSNTDYDSKRGCYDAWLSVLCPTREEDRGNACTLHPWNETDREPAAYVKEVCSGFHLPCEYLGTLEFDDVGFYVDIFVSETDEDSLPITGAFAYDEGVHSPMSLWFAIINGSVDYGVVSHEASHLIDFILTETGMRLDDTENRAYRLGSTCRTIAACLSNRCQILV